MQEKMYNFDEIIERRGTNSYKYDLLNEVFGRDDLLSLWVADMDFKTPDFIVEALKKACEQGVLGYSKINESYYDSVIKWVKRRHQWDVERDWISYMPGVVKGIAYAILHFTQPGDKVIIQPPVYHPFRLVPESMNRTIVNNPLRLTDKGYEMDFDNLRQVITPECKMLIMSSPHNPGGIVWSKETLCQLAEICAEHHILVVSDEIHSEMTFPGITHHPFASVSETAKHNSITFMAPSKTFNIPGTVTSYCIVPDQKLRESFFDFLSSKHFNSGTIFSYVAAETAYTQGDAWLKQMLTYVKANLDYVTEYCHANLESIQVYQPRASFLVWLDCRQLGLNQKDLIDLFVNKAHLALNEGTMFGPGGEGFMRLNIGCPRSILKKAMNSLKCSLHNK